MSQTPTISKVFRLASFFFLQFQPFIFFNFSLFRLQYFPQYQHFSIVLMLKQLPNYLYSQNFHSIYTCTDIFTNCSFPKPLHNFHSIIWILAQFPSIKEIADPQQFLYLHNFRSLLSRRFHIMLQTSTISTASNSHNFHSIRLTQFPKFLDSIESWCFASKTPLKSLKQYK